MGPLSWDVGQRKRLASIGRDSRDHSLFLLLMDSQSRDWRVPSRWEDWVQRSGLFVQTEVPFVNNPSV